jgi:hypothetical protein
MKRITGLFIGMLLCVAVNAKDFHFVYIALDNTMDFSQVNQKLNSLKNQIRNNNEDFILLFSNSYPKTITSKLNEIDDIQREIANTASFTAIDVPEELNIFLKIFEDNEVCQVVRDTTENKLRIMPKGDYKAISLDFFVGDDFFDSDYNNNLLAKFLFASDLQLKDFNVDIYYYNTSNLNEEKIKFNKIFTGNNLKIHLK